MKDFTNLGETKVFINDTPEKKIILAIKRKKKKKKKKRLKIENFSLYRCQIRLQIFFELVLKFFLFIFIKNNGNKYNCKKNTEAMPNLLKGITEYRDYIFAE